MVSSNPTEKGQIDQIFVGKGCFVKVIYGLTSRIIRSHKWLLGRRYAAPMCSTLYFSEMGIPHMKWLFGFFCLLQCQMIYAKMPEGPCASEKHYPGLAAQVADKSIPFRKERVDGQDMICWQQNYDDAVHQIMEVISGVPPSKYSYGVDSHTLMNEVSNALSEAGISYKRGVFNRSEYIEWSPVDDEKSIEVIKSTTGYDINKARVEIKNILDQKYNNSHHSPH